MLSLLSFLFSYFLYLLNLIFLPNLFSNLFFIVGSKHSFFNLSNLVFPLLGSFIQYSGIFFILLKLLLFKSINPINLILYHIPGLISSIYVFSKNQISKSFIILSCFVLFLYHPIGLQSWFYTLYWTIPLIIYISKKESIFLNFLASTFMSHSIGSIIWLYTHNYTNKDFLHLMPQVAIERLSFAILCTLFYLIIKLSIKYFIININNFFNKISCLKNI